MKNRQPARSDAGLLSERLAVSPREAAELLGVGADMVYELLNAGKLRSVALTQRRDGKVGRRLIPVKLRRSDYHGTSF